MNINIPIIFISEKIYLQKKKEPKKKINQKEKSQKKNQYLIKIKFFHILYIISISTLNTNIFIILDFSEKVYIFEKYF